MKNVTSLDLCRADVLKEVHKYVNSMEDEIPSQFMQRLPTTLVFVFLIF